MTVTQIDMHWFSAFDGGIHTIDVNIPPAAVMLSTALQGQAGGGLNFTGISHYRRRHPDGSDEDIGFGDWPNWPAAVFDTISSVTFAIAIGSDQETWLLDRMDYWA
jgi:hypothetical protein